MLYGLRHGGWVSMQIKKWAQTAKVVFASGHTLCQSSSYSLMFDDIGQKLWDTIIDHVVGLRHGCDAMQLLWDQNCKPCLWGIGVPNDFMTFLWGNRFWPSNKAAGQQKIGHSFPLLCNVWQWIVGYTWTQFLEEEELIQYYKIRRRVGVGGW